jgi:hypothetical protein
MFEENIVATEDEALRFISKFGFVTLFPIKGFIFPNLYQATATENEKERFETMWQWADDLAEKKKIHYGKLIRKQVTLISLEMFPCFYKLCRKRKLGETAKKILYLLKKKGTMSTTLLKKNLSLTGKAKKYEFMNAIDELQMAFLVAIVGREKAPRMTYSYDLIERWMPIELVKRAEGLDESRAKRRIEAKLLENEVFSGREGVEAFLKKL